jgi:DNA-binding NtrC family response regulator
MRIGRARHRRRRGPIDEAVLFVSDTTDWPAALIAAVARDGYVALRVDDLTTARAFLGKGGVKALFMIARPLGAKDVLVLRECRRAFPATAIVAMTTASNQPDLKRAFESGATAFLSWPADPDVVRQALESAAVSVAPGGKEWTQ